MDNLRRRNPRRQLDANVTTRNMPCPGRSGQTFSMLAQKERTLVLACNVSATLMCLAILECCMLHHSSSLVFETPNV